MLYKIKLIGSYDKNLIEKIQQEHKEKVQGIYELYDNLYMVGYCESYNKARIYYVGYTLADNNIEFEIEGW